MGLANTGHICVKTEINSKHHSTIITFPLLLHWLIAWPSDTTGRINPLLY